LLACMLCCLLPYLELRLGKLYMRHIE
jgi:hypothetical protein